MFKPSPHRRVQSWLENHFQGPGSECTRATIVEGEDINQIHIHGLIITNDSVPMGGETNRGKSANL